MDARGHTTLALRVSDVWERVIAACRRAGRPKDNVEVVAVTKTVPVEVARAVYDEGIRDLGESRPQELWRKAEAIDHDVRWHLVGHLQRNKVQQTLPLVHLIHSVDSLRLLTAIEKEAAEPLRVVEVLLQVNASREASKHGFTPEEVPGLAAEINKLYNVRVRGLMTMAAYDEDAEKARPTFALVRQLRDRLRGEVGPKHALDQLSMGMSNDFEVAIEEGATLVRLGTVLFEGLS
jgi:pyridoxal phosphate enzyme (YggS family)